MTQTTQTDEAFGRMAELQQRLIEGNLTADEKSELAAIETRLYETYQAIERGFDAPESLDFAKEPISTEELEEFFAKAAEGEILQAAVARTTKTMKDAQAHRLPLPTYAWRTVVNNDGTRRIQRHKLRYRSASRGCIAALAALSDSKERALLVRTKRFVLDLPSGAIEREVAERFGLPTELPPARRAAEILFERYVSAYAAGEAQAAFKMMPSWELHLKEILSKEQQIEIIRSMPFWEQQRAYALLRLELTLEHEGLTAIDSTVLSSARLASEEYGPGGRLTKVYVDRLGEIDSAVITGVDHRLVGEEGTIAWDLKQLPYMSTLFSTAAVEKTTGKHDYRSCMGQVLTPHELDAVSRFLGHGRWKQDGFGYSIAPDTAPPAWQGLSQVRAKRGSAIVKGLLGALDIDYVEHRLSEEPKLIQKGYRHAAKLDKLKANATREAWKLRHTNSGGARLLLHQAKCLREEAYAWHLKAAEHERIYRAAQPKLERMLRDAKNGSASALFAAGDQVKTGQCDDGRFLVAGTYLRGRVYDMAFNSQGLQLLRNEASPELGRYMLSAVKRACYYPLLTPEGIAEVVDSHIAQLRMEGGEVDEGEIDTLRMMLLSSAIRHTTEAKEARMFGVLPEEGGVRVPGKGTLRQLDSIWAAHVAHTLRTWGLTLRGGLLLTAEDSMKTCRKMWSGEAGFDFGEGLELLHYERTAARYSWYEGSREKLSGPRYAALSEAEQACYRPVYGRRGRKEPLFVLPAPVVDLINGDNDGDLVAGLAADVTLKGGRIVKLVFVMRYPVIDAAVVFALPAGTPTPFDVPFQEVVTASMSTKKVLETGRRYAARYPELFETPLENLPKSWMIRRINEAANARFVNAKRFLEILDARIPENADLFGDEVVLCESRLIRLRSDSGIKSTFKQEKLAGRLTPRRSLDMVYRKSLLRWTGPLTRKHERFGVRLLFAAHQMEHVKSDQEAKRWRAIARELVRRMRTNGDTIEEQVTSFKKQLSEEQRSPSLWLGERDPHFEDWEQVAEAIPVDYHQRIERLGHILDEFKSYNDSFEALETMGYFGPQENGRISKAFYPYCGKETVILNRLLETVLTDVARAFSKIQTGLRAYVTDLDRLVKESSPEIEAERAEALAQLESWRSFWRGENGEGGVMDHYGDILESAGAQETEEAVKRAKDFVQQAARAKKEALRLFGEQCSLEGLILAVADHWSTDGQKLELGDRDVEIQVNAAPAIAMLGERLPQVFPLEELKVRAELRKAKRICVFTTSAELQQIGLTQLPALPGEQVSAASIVFDEQRGVFIARLESGELLPWHLADGEALPSVDPERAPQRHLVALSPCRALLYL